MEAAQRRAPPRPRLTPRRAPPSSSRASRRSRHRRSHGAPQAKAASRQQEARADGAADRSPLAAAQASDAGIAAALAIGVGIYVLGVWVPYLLYLIAPEPTTRRLSRSMAGCGRRCAAGQQFVSCCRRPAGRMARTDHPRRMMCLTTAVRSVCRSTLTTGHVSALIRRAAVRSGRDAVPNWTVQPGVPARDRTEPIVGPHRRWMP